MKIKSKILFLIGLILFIASGSIFAAGGDNFTKYYNNTYNTSNGTTTGSWENITSSSATDIDTSEDKIEGSGDQFYLINSNLSSIDLPETISANISIVVAAGSDITVNAAESGTTVSSGSLTFYTGGTTSSTGSPTPGEITLASGNTITINGTYADKTTYSSPSVIFNSTNFVNQGTVNIGADVETTSGTFGQVMILGSDAAITNEGTFTLNTKTGGYYTLEDAGFVHSSISLASGSHFYNLENATFNYKLGILSFGGDGSTPVGTAILENSGNCNFDISGVPVALREGTIINNGKFDVDSANPVTFGENVTINNNGETDLACETIVQGTLANNNGTVNVSGTGSVTIQSGASVTNGPNASMTFEDGTSLTIDPAGEVDGVQKGNGSFVNQGTVNNQGTIQNDGDMSNSGNIFNKTGGKYNLGTTGSLVNDGGFLNERGSEFNNDSTSNNISGNTPIAKEPGATVDVGTGNTAAVDSSSTLIMDSGTLNFSIDNQGSPADIIATIINDQNETVRNSASFSANIVILDDGTVALQVKTDNYKVQNTTDGDDYTIYVKSSDGSVNIPFFITIVPQGFSNTATIWMMPNSSTATGFTQEQIRAGLNFKDYYSGNTTVGSNSSVPSEKPIQLVNGTVGIDTVTLNANANQLTISTDPNFEGGGFYLTNANADGSFNPKAFYVQVNQIPITIGFKDNTVNAGNKDTVLDYSAGTNQYSISTVDTNSVSNGNWEVDSVLYTPGPISNLSTTQGTPGSSLGSFSNLNTAQGSIRFTNNRDLGYGSFPSTVTVINNGHEQEYITVPQIVNGYINKDAFELEELAFSKTEPANPLTSYKVLSDNYEDGIFWSDLLEFKYLTTNGDTYSADVYAQNPNTQNPSSQGNNFELYSTAVGDSQTLGEAIANGDLVFTTSDSSILKYNKDTLTFEFGGNNGDVLIYIQNAAGDVTSQSAPIGYYQFLPITVNSSTTDIELTDNTLTYYNSFEQQSLSVGLILIPPKSNPGTINWVLTGPGSGPKAPIINFDNTNADGTLTSSSNSNWSLVPTNTNPLNYNLVYKGNGEDPAIGNYVLSATLGDPDDDESPTATCNVTVMDTNVYSVVITNDQGEPVEDEIEFDLADGNTQQFNFLTENDKGETITGYSGLWTLSWKNSATGNTYDINDYAYVNPNTGLVHFYQETPSGTALILQVISGGKTATNPVEITIVSTGVSAALEGITPERNPLYLDFSDSPYQLADNILGIPSGVQADPDDITFTCNSSYVTIDRNGNLIIPNAQYTGSTTVTASITLADGTVSTTNFVVNITAPVAATGMQAENTLNFYLNQGTESQNVNARLLPENTTAQYDFDYDSENYYICTVDSFGNVIPTGNVGTTTVVTTTQVGGNIYQYLTTVNVYDTQVTSLTLNPTTVNLSLAEGQTDTATITATTVPAGNESAVTWSVADDNIATISATTGASVEVTGVSEGQTTVTAQIGDLTTTATVNVSEEPVGPENISLTPDPVYLATTSGARNTQQMTATCTPAGDYDITWSITPTSVATISEDGLVTAVSEGTATVTATVGDVSATAQVIVNNNPVICDGLEITTQSPDYYTLTAKNVQANPAINATGTVQQVAMFTWSTVGSNGVQNDMQCKQAIAVGNGDWSWSNFDVNDTYAYYNHADSIIINVYGSLVAGQNGNMIGGQYYKSVNNMSAQGYNDAYIAYCQDIGFDKPSILSGNNTSLDSNDPNNYAGTVGQVRQMEGVRISSNIEGVGVTAAVHVENLGWQAAVGDGEYAGTMHRNLQIESLNLNLTGANSSQYTIQYRVHQQNIGWSSWVSGGTEAGVTGQHLQLEAYQVRIVPVGTPLPTN